MQLSEISAIRLIDIAECFNFSLLDERYKDCALNSSVYFLCCAREDFVQRNRVVRPRAGEMENKGSPGESAAVWEARILSEQCLALSST